MARQNKTWHGELFRIAFPGSLAFLFALFFCGCGVQTPTVKVEGGQTHEVNVHHDPQRTDVWIHRDHRRHPNPAPK